MQFYRTQDLPQSENHKEYLPSLRIDFRHRCAYCERPESLFGGGEFFEIDHFRPTSRFRELVNEYSNLYYSCGKCNRYKGSSWPSENLMERGFRFSDPCAEDMYITHLSEDEDGRLEAVTPCGQYTVDHIGLNRRQDLVRWRQTRREVRLDIGGCKKDCVNAVLRT